MHISNEKGPAERGKMQNIELKGKRSTRTCNGANPSIAGDKKYKPKPDPK